MKNQISSYDQQQIELFEQELFNSNTILIQAQELKRQVFVLFMSYICLIVGAFFYFLHRESIHQLHGGNYLFLIFPLIIYQIRKYHKSYLLEKKSFSENYKQFLIPQMLRSLQAEYHYKANGEFTHRENRNIDSDIQKISNIGLWLGEDEMSQKSYYFFHIFNPWNIFGFFSKNNQKADFEDFFSIEKDNAKFQAIEIQKYPLSVNQTPFDTDDESGSGNKIDCENKFLTKFSYTEAKYLLQKNAIFFIKLTSSKTKQRNFELNLLKIGFYFIFSILLISPFICIALIPFVGAEEDDAVMLIQFFFLLLIANVCFIFIFDLDPRKIKKSDSQNPLANARKGSILFSEDFLDYYDIQTNDQLFANDFLNPSLKEKLMLLHQHYKGSYDFYFEGKDFYCIKHLPKGKHFLDSFSHRNRKHKKTLTKLYAEIKELDLLFSLLER